MDMEQLKEQIGIIPVPEVISIFKEHSFDEIQDHILLLILDNHEAALEYLKTVDISLEFKKKLKNSEFYLHRLVAATISNEREILLDLVNDNIGIVAKTALSNINLNDLEAKEIIQRIFMNGTVYVQCGVIPLLSRIKNENIVYELVDTIKTLSWRVRLCLITNLKDFPRSLNLYEKFLDDPDENVRIALASHSSIVNFMMIKDKDENVRLTYLRSLIDYQNAKKIKNFITEDIIKSIIEDKSEKIKLEALKLNNKDLSLRIIPLFINNKKWRVRREVCESIYNLKFIGFDEFTKNLWPYLKLFFLDSVNDVRKFVADVFLDLCQEFGDKWIEMHLNFLKELSNYSNYLVRQNISKIVIKLKITDIVIKLLNDKISNVILTTLNNLNEIWSDEIFQIVSDLSLSQQEDIRIAASQVLERCV